MAERINSYRDLRVYQLAMEAAMEIFQLSKSFPSEERFSMTDQIRRASRAVCTNIAEAWRKRRYGPAFIAKLSDAETEACETQVWLEFSRRCAYLSDAVCARLDDTYDHIMAQLVRMIDDADKWIVKPSPTRRSVDRPTQNDSPIRRFAVSPIREV